VKVLITGGADFIDFTVVRSIFSRTADSLASAVKLIHAANLESQTELILSERYVYGSRHGCYRIAD